jgi:uncharacterized membrane protein YcaP (DUF421 family)
VGDAVVEIILRSTVIFFFIWILTRALGKRELAEMTAFELILLVTIGDLVQQGVTQEDMSVTGAVLAVGTIGLWILLFGYMSFRWRSTEPVINGYPVIVVRDGQPLEEVLRIERVPVDEVLEAARNQGIGDLSDVRFGIIEPDGRFSFLRYSGGEQQPAERRKAE